MKKLRMRRFWMGRQGETALREAAKSENISAFCRGSITVELAAILPVLLLTVFGALLVIFVLHDRTWLYGAAQEAAAIGATTETAGDASKALENAKERAEKLREDFFGNSSKIRLEVEEDVGEIQVQYQSSRSALYGGMMWSFTAVAKRKALDPVKIMRRLRRKGGV